MKKLTYIASLVATVFLFAACNTSEYDLENLIPEQYRKVVCFKDQQEAEWELFDVGSSLSSEFTILRSGGMPEPEAKTAVVSMTQEELTLLDEDYILLDPSFYQLPASVDFASDERYKNFTVTIAYDKIQELKANSADLPAGKSYCLAIKLDQEGDTYVDKESNYILRKVFVSDPVIDISLGGGQQVLRGEQPEIVFTLPFVNPEFEIKWDIAFESESFTAMSGIESTALGNSIPAKYNLRPLPLTAVQNGDVKSMGAGESEVKYSFKMPEGSEYGNYYVNVSISNVTINGNPLTIVGAENGRIDAQIRYEYCPDISMSGITQAYVALSSVGTVVPPGEMTFVPESAHGTSEGQAIDNNTGTFWENRWGGSGYGTTGVPFLATLNLGSVQTVSILEVWRRSGSYVTDLRKFEVYAAETIDCSNKESIKYTGLTFLGNVDFGGTSNKNVSQLFTMDAMKTQNLLLKFVGSNRNGTCISIAEIGCWRSNNAQ